MTSYREYVSTEFKSRPVGMGTREYMKEIAKKWQSMKTTSVPKPTPVKKSTPKKVSFKGGELKGEPMAVEFQPETKQIDLGAGKKQFQRKVSRIPRVRKTPKVMLAPYDFE
jgi:hypothetical protein